MTKSIIECLLTLEDFMRLPTLVRIAFKKNLIIEHQKHIRGIKVIELSPEEQHHLKGHLPRYMPAIRLNLEQVINEWIVQHEQERQKKKTLGEITPNDLLSLFIRISRIDGSKAILPLPLNI